MHTVSIIIFVIILFSFIYYEIYEKHIMYKIIPDNYDEFSNEINKDMIKYKLDLSDQFRLKSLISDINSEKKERTFKDYLKSSHSGMIRGVIVGAALGTNGIGSCVANAVTFGLLNPLMMYAGY